VAVTINGNGAVTGLTALPDSAMAEDSVIQVVTNSTNTEVSNSTSTYADTGLSCSITPSLASSKILVIVDQQMQIYSPSSGNNGFGVQLLRGSTVIVNGGPSNTVGPFGYYFAPFSGSLNLYLRHHYSHYDSPSYSVGDTFTYKTQMRRYNSPHVVKAQLTDAAGDSGVSRMILMEVKS
tara:strand:+ start:409 stop:945 length:537 start_codon:yes stop_codon:yes gene_type:complete